MNKLIHWILCYFLFLYLHTVGFISIFSLIYIYIYIYIFLLFIFILFYYYYSFWVFHINNAVVWTVSTRPPTSKSSSPFSNPLVTVPNAPITIGIIVTCMFHSFFNSLARSRYLSFFSFTFSFILWSAGTANSTIFKILFYYYYYYYFEFFTPANADGLS